MSDAKSPTDLSLDEILATMRRIIDEDEHAPAAPQPPKAAAAPTGPEPPAENAAHRSGERQSGGPQSGEPEDAVAAPQPEAGDGILELTEALNEDGTVRHLAPIGLVRAPRTAAPAPETETYGLRSERGTIRREPLLSDAGAAATAAALAKLSTIPRDTEAPATPRVNERPLEDIVAELLHPLLRTWLDNHLPALVERLVQREIDRALSRPGPD